jgi:hypothetical protein
MIRCIRDGLPSGRPWTERLRPHLRAPGAAGFSLRAECRTTHGTLGEQPLDQRRHSFPLRFDTRPRYALAVEVTGEAASGERED